MICVHCNVSEAHYSFLSMKKRIKVKDLSNLWLQNNHPNQTKGFFLTLTHPPTLTHSGPNWNKMCNICQTTTEVLKITKINQICTNCTNFASILSAKMIFCLGILLFSFNKSSLFCYIYNCQIHSKPRIFASLLYKS